MTATEWLTIMVIVVVAEGLWLIGESIYRQVVQWRTHHRVPHYKLRAASARGKIAARIAASPTVPIARPELRTVGHLQGDVPTTARRGSAAGRRSVEPRPVPARHETSPGAGPNLQAGDSRLDRGSAVGTASGQPQPAPGPSGRLPGAGPQPRTAALSALPSRGEAAPYAGSGGLGHSSRSESAPPDPAPIGVEPRLDGEGAQGCASRAGAVHETAPTTRSAV